MKYIFQNHFKAIFPEIFLLTGIIILLVYAVIYNAMAYYKFPILTTVIGWLSIQVLILTIWLITNQSIPFTSWVVLNNVLDVLICNTTQAHTTVICMLVGSNSLINISILHIWKTAHHEWANKLPICSCMVASW